MLAQLFPLDGGDPITLSRPITVVGRSARICDLSLRDARVSKLHCILVKTDGLIYMRDLGSTNGTRVNGQRVLRGALLPGDHISFSGATFRVHLGPDQDDPADSGVHDTDADQDVPGAAIDPTTTNSDVRLITDSEQNSFRSDR